MATIGVREGTFSGGLPYLAVGSGEPLVYLCGSTSSHRNPRPGLERIHAANCDPLARAGFKVYFTNRWPGMAPIPPSPMLPSGMPRRFSTTSAGLWTCWATAPADPWPFS